MFQLTSEQMLIRAFRPRDRRGLELPVGLTYPHFVRYYLAWVDPTGAHANIVFSGPGGAPTGIAFRRGGRGGEKGIGLLCDWCHSQGGPDEVGLLTTDASSKRRVGIVVCQDLRCQEKIEDAANRSGRSVLDATRAMMGRIHRFAHEALGIDLSGASRD